MTEVKPATDAVCDWCERLKTNHMSAYYYAFDATGTPEIDRILCSVAHAGKAYHHTEEWSEGVLDLIQNAAKEAAARIEADRAEIAALRSQVKRCHAIIQDFDALTDPGDGLHEEALKELSGEFCPGACTTACNVAQDEDRAEIARLKAHLDETLYERDRLKAEVERLARPESSDLCPKCKGGKRDIFDANRVCFLCDGTGRAR